MSSSNYIRGMQDLHSGIVGSARDVFPGTFLWRAANAIKPASLFPWQGSLAATQMAFAEVFIGVSQGYAPAHTATAIPIDMSPFSVYSFHAPAYSDYRLGDIMAPARALDGSDALSDQLLVRVYDPRSGIGRIADDDKGHDGMVPVQLASAFAAANGFADLAISESHVA